MAISLVNAIPGGAYNTPGPQSIVPNNSTGNLIALLAAWDVSTQVTPGSGVVPVGAVADSSENWWRLAGDSTSVLPGCRVAIWICSNALAVTRWLSFCPQGYVSSFLFWFLELGGLPANYWPTLDYNVANSSPSSASLANNGTATLADFALALGAAGSTAPTVTTASAGWTTVGTTSVGGANPNGVKATAAFGTFAAGSVPITWAYSIASVAAAVNVGFSQASNLPVQINPNFPRVFVEAAFGTNPGDPTTAILDTQYSDLSQYCIGPGGQSIVSFGHGQAYELSQPESGTCTIAMNNQAGTFNPTNASSPFFPNIVPGVPVRVSAQFSGRRYPLWAGYVERWPQDWPDFPQWGWSSMIATDGVGVASSVNLPSAVQGEILADNPYFCFPFSEQYSSSQNTINGVVKSPTATDGLLAVNTSPTNQATATYIDGAGAPVVTGQSLGFLGDSGTGMGASAYSGLDLSGFRGPGAQYGPDSGLPNLQAGGAGDATFEFWFFPPTQPTPGVTQNVQLFELLCPPFLGSNGAANLGGGVFIMGGISYRSDGTMAWYTQEAWAASVTAITNLQEGVLHHFLLIMSGGVLTFWLDGVNFGTVGGMPQPTQLIAAVFGLATYSYGNHGANSNFSLAYGTLYPYVLQANRITSHYTSGINGFVGDTQLQRAGRYVAWARLNLGLAGPTGNADHLLLSSAYSTNNSPLAAALNADAQGSGGTWHVSNAGNLVILPRNYAYDLPTALIFGENVASGEIPYDPDTAFDFDNTYLQNSAQATLNQGPNSLATPVVRSPSSTNQYFQRGPLQQSVSALTVQDATDRATWSLNKYQQASLRVRQMKVNLASRPSAIAAVLGAGLTTTALVNRRPLSQGSYSLPVVIGKTQMDIGPGKWEVTYQMYPGVPENTTLLAGWQFITSGTPANNFFIVSTGQSALINVGDTFTDTNNPGVTFTVTGLSAPFAGFVNVSITPNAATLMSAGDVVTQAGSDKLGSNVLAW